MQRGRFQPTWCCIAKECVAPLIDRRVVVESNIQHAVPTVDVRRLENLAASLWSWTGIAGRCHGRAWKNQNQNQRHEVGANARQNSAHVCSPIERDKRLLQLILKSKNYLRETGYVHRFPSCSNALALRSPATPPHQPPTSATMPLTTQQRTKN
jgi:hypothetical protein